MSIPYEVQNAQKVDGLDDRRLAGYDEILMQPKLDGFRIIAHVMEDRVELWTRAGKPQHGKVPYIEAQLAQTFPAGTVLDGEICHGLGANGFEYVQQVMLSKPDEAVRKWDGGSGVELEFVVFDVLEFENVDIRGYGYGKRVERIADRLRGADRPANVSLIATVEADESTHAEFMYEFGFEGTILRDPDAKYQSGKRGGGLFKWKPQDEVDAVIVGFQPGTPGSEFDGLVGAIIFGQPYDYRVKSSEKTEIYCKNGVDYAVRGKCSGFPMDVRRRLTEIQDEMIGTVISFKHMGQFPDSIKFRHPQFSRFRPDKKASEVIWDG